MRSQQVNKHFRLKNDTCVYSEMTESNKILSKYICETMPKSFNWSYIDDLARYVREKVTHDGKVLL